jgi:hypothetical protein
MQTSCLFDTLSIVSRFSEKKEERDKKEKKLANGLNDEEIEVLFKRFEREKEGINEENLGEKEEGPIELRNGRKRSTITEEKQERGW